MSINELIVYLRGRINPAYADVTGTESYERQLCVDALEAQRAEIERHGGHWMTIETAPKYESILLFCPRRGVVRGRWDDCSLAKNPRPYWTNDRELPFGVAATRADQPTHWMPLPAPPRKEGSDA